jgi:hypothetical protein
VGLTPHGFLSAHLEKKYRIIVHEVLSVRWGGLGRGIRKEDGWVVKSGGDDEEVRWIPADYLRG